MDSNQKVISELLQKSGIQDFSHSDDEDEDEFFDAIDDKDDDGITLSGDVTAKKEGAEDVQESEIDSLGERMNSISTKETDADNLDDEHAVKMCEEEVKTEDEDQESSVADAKHEGGSDLENYNNLDEPPSCSGTDKELGSHGNTDAYSHLHSDDDDDGDVGGSRGDKEEKSRVFTTLEEDEQPLKEIEKDMTDEEKENRKEEAQTLKAKGNEVFKNGDYSEAIDAYTQALHVCPLCYQKERSIMYSNRGACHVRMENNEEAVSDCSKAIELHSTYTKALLRRAQTYEKMEKLDEALADYQKVLELDPSSWEARQACMRLPDEIKERNEKMKAEMMGKLKDLGNMILRPFGLSTNNFQLNQDPSTGSYSVNFVQNKQGNGQ